VGPRKNLFKVHQISIKGVKKVEKEAILEKISIKEGMTLDNYLLRRDMAKIYAMKYFEWVEVHRRKVKGKNVLEFLVKEKPIITKIKIVGNDGINEDDIKDQVKTKEFSILDINTIKRDMANILKHYEEKGYYLASVNYELNKVANENVELVFNIKELQKVRVKKVTFLGNKAFSDEQLKSIMMTREEHVFSFMDGSGNFKEFDFQTDVEKLKYFYKMKGYLQVGFSSPTITISEDKRWVFITLKVNEGPRFTVNEINFQGEVLFPDEELKEEISLKEGEHYSEESLRKDIQLLTEKYQDQGYAFANVLRHLYPVPGENRVDVEFSFEKGTIAYFGEITIKGNTKTRDKVIRRELRIKEGEKYNGTALRESKEFVNRLGFFEKGSVIFNTVSPKGKDDVLDVEITVKERNTGQISLGAGYSTSGGAFMNASITQNNFRGLGQILSFSLTLSGDQKSFNLSFTEPYLFDSKWLAGGDIYRTINERSTAFRYEKIGATARVAYPIYEFSRLFFSYKIEDTEISAVNDPTIDPETENGVASSVRTALVRDTRDNIYEPSKGYYMSISSEYAGVGGDKKWLKNDFDGRAFWNVYGEFVFRSRLYAARLNRIDGRRIPRTEKFSLGGARNLRGYDFEDIGPKTTVVDNVGRTIRYNSGGLFSSFTQIELEHPLAKEAGLKWVLFFDAGYAGEYENFKLYKDYGFGFRWFSPIGVLRFEFGYPMDEGDDITGSQFHFDIGQLF
jgi:outer membrane protein insertion porin family